jgi:hypothetical protein
VGFKTIKVFNVDGTEHKRYMRSRRKKYCSAGISDAPSHLFLKQNGGRDLAGPGKYRS